MKKNEVNQAKQNGLNVTVKNVKTAVTVNDVANKPNKKEAKEAILLELSKDVSLNGFCKLIAKIKEESPAKYKELMLAHNLGENFEITFEWFKENCPKDENEKFAKWRKVNDTTVLANENPQYNRVTAKGVRYTLVPYNISKANYKVFLDMFSDVVSEVNRLRTLAESKVKAAKKEESEKSRSRFPRVQQTEIAVRMSRSTQEDDT